MTVKYEIRVNIPEIRKVWALVEPNWDIIRKLSTDKGYVGLVPGVFDILHPGHLEFLCWAKARCEYLIAALATDSSIIARKGSNPIYNFEQRAFMVASTRYIDTVTQYTYGEILELLVALKPNALIQGHNRISYIPDQIRLYMAEERIEYIIHSRAGTLSTRILKEYIKNAS